jgi:YidC/Oxa1 family membrane protein insertase
MFQTLIVKPIFNLLTLIYALLPGHNFGLAIIIFTIIVRLLMWPLVKKQLHQAKAMRKLQPELKRIKAAAKGDKQKESAMLMELYKERGVNPFGSIGSLVIQFIILIGLYSGLRRVVDDPQAIVTYSYGWVQNLDWVKALAGDINKFDASLLGVVDLKRAAIQNGTTYWPALLIVFGSAMSQYYTSKQLMPSDKDGRSLRTILKEASGGTKTEQSEVNAAVGRSTRYLIPFMIFFITIGLPAALSLYWLVSGVTAYLQQAKVLNQDEEELEALADSDTTTGETGKTKVKIISKGVIEGEIVEKKTKPTPKKKSAKSKRRKK